MPKLRTRFSVGLALLVAFVAVPSPPAGADPWEAAWVSETQFRGRRHAVAWDVVVQPDGRQVEVGEYGGDAFVLRYSVDLGWPDGGFEGHGVAVLDTGGTERALGVALQADGSILASGQVDGDLAVWRLTPQGALDATFGSGGLVRLDLGTDDDAGSAVEVLADGRIVVAGWTGTDVALVRLATSGAPDPSFGTGGSVVRDLGSEEWAESLAVTAVGELVVAGGRGLDSLVARFTRNGSPDADFGTAGARVLDVGGADTARDLTLDALGRPVVAGVAGDRAYVARLLPSGSSDPSFAGDGSVVTALRGTPAQATGVVVLADARIVIAGSTGEDGAIAAFHPTGLRDTSFADGNEGWSSVYGTGGMVLSGLAVAPDGGFATAGWEQSGYASAELRPLAARYGANGTVSRRDGLELERTDRAADLVVQPDGRAVAVVSIGVYQRPSGDIGVARFESDGELDPTFGVGGRVILDHPSAEASDEALDAELQPDGKIVISGMVAGAAGVVRLQPDGSLVPTSAPGAGPGSSTWAAWT